jgi:cobalt-zinc-cadmium resistance protein CzcA
VVQGPKIRLGHMARANHLEDGRIIDEPDVIQGGVLMRKGAEEQPTLDAIHKKVDEFNNGILPPGVKVVPMLDRSDLLHFTLHTVMHNLAEGMILVSIILFLFLLNARAAVHRRAHDSVLSAFCIDLPGFEPHSGEPSLAGSAGFRNGGGWSGGHGGKHYSPPDPHPPARMAPSENHAEIIREACHEVQRPVFYAIAIIITAYLPIFTLQRVEGRLFRPMAWTVAFALLGAMTFSILIVPVLASMFFRKGSGAAQPRHGISGGLVSEAVALGG